LPASTRPAAHQRSAICLSRQRLTLPACSRHTEIIDSMLLESTLRAALEREFTKDVGPVVHNDDVSAA
jgi:hypothetical protein